ncbi:MULTISPECIES: phosphatase PAP2 family protein [Brachybacterium]|uniref:Phosphatidic acid phosphatase n=3 Tax=Brachybacterium TaxID=43668 RepID=A0A426SJ20_9MICO|nr:MULTISPECIES: phosphatase PAP2 family protein [Brachybacterium]RRR18163.1 phosphatidic acid phosphatase [Brachybacterium paraconglomeratum]GLI30260.1 phosphatidic acid phosphatase [Brachybacterium conglomeratum]GLK04798.1 phosphatidic acid phosphatase [Brachybacterium conglomeratum]
MTALESLSAAEPAPPSPVGLARPLLSLLVAAVCGAAVAMMARGAVGTASGQRLDQLTLSGSRNHDGLLSRIAELAVETVSMPVIIALLALTAVIALLRRRPALLLPLASLVLGANLTTQVIKHLLVSREVLGPGIEPTTNSFPSGHSTLAATTMIALVLVAGRARPLVAPLGLLWSGAAGIGTLVTGWHRPSDVIGAIAVSAAWTFLVLGVDGLHTRRRLRRAAAHAGRGRRRRGRDLRHDVPRLPRAELACALVLGAIGAVGLVAGAAGIAGLPLPLDLADRASQLAAFRATGAVIAGATAAWVALVLVLRTPSVLRTPPAERVP